jgi:hypothetical protein
LALPQKGHLEAVFHIYAYLKKKTNSTIIMDLTYPDIYLKKFNDGAAWSNFYGDIQEAIPPNIPKPKGKTLVITLFVDSDHANDKSLRRSRTGFILYPNSASVIWYSKRQGTIETSVFGAEFAMRTGIEAGRALLLTIVVMKERITNPIPLDSPGN